MLHGDRLGGIALRPPAKGKFTRRDPPGNTPGLRGSATAARSSAQTRDLTAGTLRHQRHARA